MAILVKNILWLMPEIGGGIITRKFTYAAIVLCVMFSALPFANAAEVQNTDLNQNISKNDISKKVSVTNAVTDPDQDLKSNGLKIGAEGKHVVELQKWLKNQGYYTGAIDGSFGPYTEKAVKNFQSDSNIVVDGWVANQTINSMEKRTGKDIFTKSDNSSSNSTSSKKVKSTNVKSSDLKNTTNTTSKKTSVNKKDSKSLAKNSTAKATKVSKDKTTKVSNSTKTKSLNTKASTSTTKSVSAKTSVTSSSSLSQILASGAKYGYSHSASSAAAMMSSGSGDCWAMSDYLYSKLKAAGIKARIVQYSTKYSANHRSVQLYQNGAWVDVPYSSYGYSTMFKATSSKPGMTVLAS